MLNVGDKAPDFDLMTDEGKQIRLRDLKGKTFVLYFYPKDDTPGCTKEACSFRDETPAFKKLNVPVFGISLDDMKSHVAFKKKFELPFTLLCDADAIVSKAYDVYKKKNMYGRTYWGIERTTFIVDDVGKVKAVFSKVKVDGHVDDVLAALKS